MKFLLLLLFTVTTPLVIFFSTILFSSDINTVLKKELVKGGVYTTLHEQILSMSPEDAESEVIAEFIKQKFTAAYLQGKADDAIDSSTAWVTGKSTTPPAVSFKDVKEEILAQNPELLTTIEEFANEAKNQPMPEEESFDATTADAGSDPDAQMQQNMESFTNLIKSDFTFKLESYLKPFKSSFATLKIIVPVLLILVIAYLGLILKLAHPLSSRLKWLGSTFIVSGLLGFVIIFFNSILIKALSSLVQTNSNEVVNIITPIALGIVKYFVDSYLLYQGITSVVFLLIAAACLVAAEFTKKSTTPVAAPATSKPKPPTKKK